MDTRVLARATGTLCFVVVVAGLGIWSLQPPDPLLDSAPPDQFSAQRALRHVERIAREPHFLGTPAHDRVREYILGQFRAAGVEVLEQPATVVRPRGPSILIARVRNIVARLAGSNGGRGVALVAHYDSAPASPGAADDAHAVAVLLESLRALQSGPRLRNDVIFLVTDGEEAGLLGAQAFVEDHPWRKQVGAVLNFEARGTAGPAWMFRTNPGSGWLVRALGEAAPYPLASSIGGEVFRYMPNNTDLTIFQRAGYPGLDFAFIDQPAFYHSPKDNLENLDLRSLQHQGSNALALARYLGGVDLNPKPPDELVYHGASRGPFLSYPRSFALPLALLATGVFGLVLAVGFRRRRMSVGGVLAGAGAILLALSGAFAAVWFAQSALQRGNAGDFSFAYRHYLYQAGLLGLAMALASTLYGWLIRKARVANLWAGAMAVWVILAVASGLYLPGVSYVFVWPLLFASAAALVGLWRGDADFDSTKSLLMALLFSLPTVLLVAQVIPALLVAFPPLGAAIATILLVLALGLLLPHLQVIGRCGGWLVPAASAAACAILLLTAWRGGGFDARHPRPDARAAAPVSGAMVTELNLAASRYEGEDRVIQLDLKPKRAVSYVSLSFDAGVELAGGSADGKLIPYARRPLLIYAGVPQEGASVELKLRGAVRPLRILVVDRSFGTPAVRPATLMQHPFEPDTTMASKSYQFE